MHQRNFCVAGMVSCFTCSDVALGQLCTATPCANGGTCLETGGSRTCDCVAGYKGQNCETGGTLLHMC